MATINLTEEQKARVREWLEQGLKLSEIQSRLESEFGIRTTYMDVKLLISDLQVLPKDPEPLDRDKPKPAQAGASPNKGALESEAGDRGKTPRRRLSVTMDQIARPGAVVSGSVTFSDGKKANWYVDEYGRIGVSPAERGYRPSEADMQEFQIALEQELTRQGF